MGLKGGMSHTPLLKLALTPRTGSVNSSTGSTSTGPKNKDDILKTHCRSTLHRLGVRIKTTGQVNSQKTGLMHHMC